MSDHNHHRADHSAQRERRQPRTRSRSPNTYTGDSRRHRHHRSRSPHHIDHRRHHHSTSQEPAVLPYDARHLSRHDLPQYELLFTMYLDIQKQLDFDELSEREVKGRWKSFVGKWNRGELAEGWYDPVTKQKADTSSDLQQHPRPRRSSPEYTAHAPGEVGEEAEDSDDDSIGPSLPGMRGTARGAGPTIPSLQDLEVQREMSAEDQLVAREDLRYARKVDRKEQKERLDELVPRAEAGTRERQLEKKREVNEKMRSFRDRSPGAMVDEVGEKDLMGDDGIDAYRAKKRDHERKKNERELRKEEILRARAAEREERLRVHRAKEEKTVGMLKALAKQNFG